MSSLHSTKRTSTPSIDVPKVRKGVPRAAAVSIPNAYELRAVSTLPATRVVEQIREVGAQPVQVVFFET
ncbi:hypothetical protein HAX54_005707, partial [Datura stramonium]|nr:hypothetical protein [Datura stramonium]